MKPKVLISRCINFEATRYNGGIVKDEFALKLGEFVEYKTICPEVDIGLSIPRDPLIVLKKGEEFKFIQKKTNLDLTEKIISYSEKVLNSLKDIDGFLLKSKSPSCGYSGTNIYFEKDGKRYSYKGKGIFARKVEEKFLHLPVEDEGRLHDPEIRFHFLVRLFSFFELKNLLKNLKEIKELLEFHQNYKYLLMAYSQSCLKKLGQTLAGYNKKNLKKIKENYKENFYKAFSRKINPKSNVNVLLHIYGYFKDKLKEKEKKHFLNLIEKYKREKIPLILIIEILKNFVLRFENDYLLDQKYLNPFPEELYQ